MNRDDGTHFLSDIVPVSVCQYLLYLHGQQLLVERHEDLCHRVSLSSSRTFPLYEFKSVSY